MATVTPHREPATGSTLTVAEAAVLLHVRSGSVHRYIDQGQLDSTTGEDGQPRVFFLQTNELRRRRRAAQAAALQEFGLMVDQHIAEQTNS